MKLGRRVAKYSTGQMTARLEGIKRAGRAGGVPEVLATGAATLLHASLARGTWQKYSSAWAAFDAYQAYTKTEFKWPLSQEAVRGFVTPPVKYNTRRVMTVALLQHLGHRLAESGWEREAVQTVWSAALVAFFGTARMGEILSNSETWVDKTSSFTWSCVKYREERNSLLLQIKLAKMRSPEGEYIDLFPFRKIPGLCPVAALKRQLELQRTMGRGRPEDPVFIYPSGNFVTTGAYNKALRVLLEDVVDFERDSISCHSFRAGLPSLIAQHPELFTEEDIKKWGRWDGASYNKYTRLTDVPKEKLFDKMKDVIN